MAFRPSDFTQVWADVICEKLACGESLRSICQNEEFPSVSTVMRWLAKEPAFQNQYARAREIQAEYHFEELIEIADDGTNDYVAKRDASGAIVGWRENGEWVNRSRLRVDTRKWAMSKMAPKKYGDKSAIEHSGPNGAPIETRDMSDDVRAKALLAFLAKTGAKLP